MFGNTPTATPGFSQPQPQANDKPSMGQLIEEMKAAYNPGVPNCAFQYVLYNLVPQVSQPPAMPNNVNPQLWQQGVSQNPAPDRLVPTVISGFEGLKKRLEDHDKLIKAHQSAVEEIEQFVVQTKRKHEYNTIEKLDEYKRKHKELAHRLLQVICKLEFYQSRGLSWYPEEETFHARLEFLQRELNKPTQFKGRLNELASQVSMLDDTPQPTYQDQIDEESVAHVRKVISQQTKNIKKLHSVVTQDIEEADVGLQVAKSIQS